MTSKSSIKQQLADFVRIPVDRLAEDRALTDVIADSFIMVEMLLNLQEDLRVELSTEDLEGVHTVGELVDMLAARLAPSAG